MAPGVAVSAGEALEAAILAALAEDGAVTGILGNPLRVMGAGPAPAFPHLEVVRHAWIDTGSAGVEASEHRIDLAVMCPDMSGARVRAAIGAVRAALGEAELVMEGWRCVVLVPLFADTVRGGVQIWRGLLRMKAVVEAS